MSDDKELALWCIVAVLGVVLGAILNPAPFIILLVISLTIAIFSDTGRHYVLGLSCAIFALTLLLSFIAVEGLVHASKHWPDIVKFLFKFG